jgi:SAM-dependent methyltransferase
MSSVDFGRHSDDYATHRPGFPPSFYERLRDVVAIEGADVVDLATGPGTMALELAARGAAVMGVDTAPEQIDAARRVARQRGLDASARFEVARAEATGLAAESFDLATAGQCWHWFDGDAALAEARRLLRPGGVLAIAYYSYLAQESAVARDTEALVLEFNPSWSMAGWTGKFPELIGVVGRGGFEPLDELCYEHDEPFSHSRWRGRIRTCNGVGSGGLSPDDVQRFDEALARLLARKYPDPLVVQHRVWCITARKRR